LTNSLEPLAREREEFVDRAFLGLGEIEIEWLERMTLSGRPTAIPDTVWTVLDRAGLVDRDFSGPKGIKDELKAVVRQRLAEHQSLAGAPEIIVSPGSKYQSSKDYTNRTTQTVSIGIRNSHPNRFIANCGCTVKLPENVSAHSWPLTDSFTLMAGEERVIPLAYYHIFFENDPKIPDRIRFHIKLPGGSHLGVGAPDLPVGTHVIMLEATSTETRPCVVSCKLWLDERGKLRLEKV
jgi:hypothetical protein